MKITFLLPADDLTGGARVVAMYARELMTLGHEVLAVVTAPQPGGGRRARLSRWAQSALPRWALPFAAAAPTPSQAGHLQLMGIPLRRLKRPGPIEGTDLPDADAVIATWWETAVWMDRLPPAKGRRLHLIQGHEVWFGREAEVHAALRLPNTKVVISEALKATLHAALGASAPALKVIANAIDPAQFNAAPRGKAKRPTVGFVYSTAHIKGADICAAACALARQAIPELQVLSFGAEPPSPQVPLPANTEFHLRPAQAKLRDLYAACDVWLFASRLDSFGLPMLEAMACRTPLVAVPMGAAEQLLAKGGGRLVAADSPEAMAQGLCEVLCLTHDAWQACANQAWQQAHGHTWQDATAALLDCLQQPV